MKKLLSNFRSIHSRRHAGKASVVVAIILFATVGTVLLFNSKAATPFASIEPEQGIKTANISPVSDATASGGSAVKFGAAPAPSSGICTGRDTNGGVPADKFPGTACTGVPPGVTLRTVPGQVTSGAGWSWNGSQVVVTLAGAVLDGLDISGCVDVQANNVTIKNSRIRAVCTYMINIYFNGSNSRTGLIVTDVELDGTDNLSARKGIQGDGFTVKRVNVHGISAKAVVLGANTLLEDSYVHDYVCGKDPDSPADTIHQSGVGTNGGDTNITMRHNHIDMRPTDTLFGLDCVSGGISNYIDFGTIDNMLIERNLINSDGFCLKAGINQGTSPYPNSTNVRVLNNTFGRKYWPECGFYGPVSNWQAGPGNVWSGNVWGDGAAATSSHQTGDPVNP